MENQVEFLKFLATDPAVQFVVSLAGGFIVMKFLFQENQPVLNTDKRRLFAGGVLALLGLALAAGGVVVPGGLLFGAGAHESARSVPDLV